MRKLAVVEMKLLIREPGAIFALLIPLFILMVFGSSIEPGDTVLLPMAVAIAVGMVGLYLLPTTLATYRERGILRRMSTTPVRPANLLAVQVALQSVLALTTCALLIAVAGTVLDAHLPTAVGTVAVTLLLGTGAMFAVGMLIAALARNGRTANGVGVLLYFPMAYLAGLMQPTSQMPRLLARIRRIHAAGRVPAEPAPGVGRHHTQPGPARGPGCLCCRDQRRGGRVLSLGVTMTDRLERWERLQQRQLAATPYVLLAVSVALCLVAGDRPWPMLAVAAAAGGWLWLVPRGPAYVAGLVALIGLLCTQGTWFAAFFGFVGHLHSWWYLRGDQRHRLQRRTTGGHRARHPDVPVLHRDDRGRRRDVQLLR